MKKKFMLLSWMETPVTMADPIESKHLFVATLERESEDEQAVFEELQGMVAADEMDWFGPKKYYEIKTVYTYEK